MYMKRMLCLASSTKKHEKGEGRCLAGREVLAGGFGSWIRPVSIRSSREVCESERQCQDGTPAQVLDVVTVPLLRPQPEHHQIENHVIDAGHRWLRHGKGTWRDVQAALDTPPGPLWINGYSTYNGQNDHVPESLAGTLRRSLYLISPDAVYLIVKTERAFNTLPKRRVRASFSLNGVDYTLVVTDPVVTGKYIRGKEGEFCIENAALCISLGEAFNGNAYKLVATVITPDMGA